MSTSTSTSTSTSSNSTLQPPPPPPAAAAAANNFAPPPTNVPAAGAGAVVAGAAPASGGSITTTPSAPAVLHATPSASASAAATAVMDSYAARPVTRYEKLNRIGEGTYGTVYRARDKVTNEIVALKKLRMMKEKGGFPLTSIREIKILKSISHPNIVQLKEVSVGKKPDSIFLVFEYCEHDFAGLLDRLSRPFTESEIKTIMLQLLSAVDYLHKNFIVHRDLKLSNLLMTNRGILKLADFGLARLFSNPLKEYTPKVVTLWYRAPELLLGSEKYHSAVDIWALGCIFGELLRHRPLLPGKTEMQQMELICSLLGTPNDKIWPGFQKLNTANIKLPNHIYNNLSNEFPALSSQGVNLLTRMLTYDPSKRITADKALLHPYFQQKPLPTPPDQMPTFPDQHINQYQHHHINYTVHQHVGGPTHNTMVVPQPPAAATVTATSVTTNQPPTKVHVTPQESRKRESVTDHPTVEPSAPNPVHKKRRIKE